MSSINKQTLSEQIYQVLRQDILTQEIKSGQKLTLHMLRDRFQVSQTPIREALTRLADDYLVEYSSNIGVTVVTFTPESVTEIFELSAELDCLGLGFSLNKNGNDFIETLKENCTKASQCLKEGNVDQWKEYSDQFHLILYKYADNSWLDRAASKMRAQLTVLSNLYQYNDNIEKIHQDHLGIHQLVETGNLAGAKNAIREHYRKDLGYAIDAIKPN